MAMLAQSFDKLKAGKGKHINFPCIIQPKLDGIRCIATVNEGTCVLHTRNDKVIASVPHINAALSKLPDGVYDGELYNHTVQFNTLSGNIRRIKSVTAENEDIDFVMYDCYNDTDTLSTSTYRARLQYLVHLDQSGKLTKPLKVIDYQECNDLEHLYTVYKQHLADGYEGSMLRTEVFSRAAKQWIDPGYEHKRSWSLLKVKEFHDAEYIITGIQEEIDKHGNPKGRTGAFELITDEGKTFTASGIPDTLKEDSWRNPSDYIGKKATIKYFEISPDRIPRFPSFKGVRYDL